MNPIPAAGTRLSSIRHRTPSGTRPPAEQESKITASDIGKRWRRVGQWLETEVRGVERQRSIYMVHHVPDANQVWIHQRCPFIPLVARSLVISSRGFEQLDRVT